MILSALDRAREAGELTVNQNGKAEQKGEGAKFLYILSASLNLCSTFPVVMASGFNASRFGILKQSICSLAFPALITKP